MQSKQKMQLLSNNNVFYSKKIWTKKVKESRGKRWIPSYSSHEDALKHIPFDPEGQLENFGSKILENSGQMTWPDVVGRICRMSVDVPW